MQVDGTFISVCESDDQKREAKELQRTVEEYSLFQLHGFLYQPSFLMCGSTMAAITIILLTRGVWMRTLDLLLGVLSDVVDLQAALLCGVDFGCSFGFTL